MHSKITIKNMCLVQHSVLQQVTLVGFIITNGLKIGLVSSYQIYWTQQSANSKTGQELTIYQ